MPDYGKFNGKSKVPAKGEYDPSVRADDTNADGLLTNKQGQKQIDAIDPTAPPMQGFGLPPEALQPPVPSMGNPMNWEAMQNMYMNLLSGAGAGVYGGVNQQGYMKRPQFMIHGQSGTPGMLPPPMPPSP